MENENEKLQNKIRQLEKELVKTGTVEEKMITEIVTRENMKNEYDSLVKTMKQKQEILIKEKEDNNQYYEKKIEVLNQTVENLNEKNRKSQEEIKDYKGILNRRQNRGSGEIGG